MDHPQTQAGGRHARSTPGDKTVAHVQLAKVQKSYGDIQILRDIDLEIRDGEFMVFVLSLIHI